MSAGNFLGELDVRILKGSERDAMVLEPLSWYDKKCGIIRIGYGFISDGASIPKWAWLLVGTPWVGFYRRAVVLHDFLCAKEGLIISKHYNSMNDAFEALPAELSSDVNISQLDDGGVMATYRLTSYMVHKIFYLAMLYEIQFFPEKTRAKAKRKAKVMYWAVRKFGPKW